MELFISGPDGGNNRRVSGSLVADGDVREFAWSPDSQHLGYRANQNSVGVLELFSSTVDSSSNVQVSGELVANGIVLFGWLWSPDSQWLAYRADQRQDDVLELFTASPDGSLNIQVSGQMVFGGDVVDSGGGAFQWSLDGTRLVYTADQLEDNKVELFVAAPDGSIANDVISGELTEDGDVFNFALE